MDPIERELSKLTAKERGRVKEILVKLARGRTAGLDIKKLRGADDIFRIRKGNIRILYRAAGEKVFLLRIDRRREDTYK